MAWQPVPLAGGHYADNARPWANQEVVNWLPVKPERPGARSELMLRDPPGLRPFSVVGTGPIRGAHNAEGSLFIVSGSGLYRISPLGVASFLGTIPGVGRVSIAHNQITGGNQVIVANGSAGYVYNTADDSFAQITDEGFPGAKSVRFLGQMILYVEPFGRYWGASDVADATSYNTIFRQEAEGSPDLILHVEPSQGEALVFGKRTIEVWTPNVTETANFARTTVIERGAASQWAIVTLDNSCIFLGDDGIVYRLNGYTPVPISHRPLEFGLKDFDISKAFAFTWEDAGFKVVYFTIPGGKTWGYDVATGEWHRRESYGLDRWRLNAIVPFARKWIGGDFADGTLWELDWDYHKEGCDELVRVVRPPVAHDNGNRIRVHGLRVTVDTGQERTADLEASITGSLPDGDQGEVVSYQYTLNGYVEGDEISAIGVTGGSLPPGLSISSTGLVTGTRSTAGTFPFTISGTDRCGNTVSLNDTSVTNSIAVTSWRIVPDDLAQSHIDVHVADGIIAIAGDNCSLTYSTDEGDSWTVLSGTAQLGLGNAADVVSGIIKFEGDWYAFQPGGSMSRAVGNSFSFASVANGPSVAIRSLAVLNGSLYCGVNNNNGGANIILRKMVTPGAAWTTIDTGIAADSPGTDEIQSACESTSGFVFVTDGGHVLYSADLETFSKVLTAVGARQVAAIGDTIIVTVDGGGHFKSTDGGATFGALVPLPGLRVIGANGYTFIAGGHQHAYTSLDGDRWTQRFDSVLEPGTDNNAAAADGGLAVIARFNNYAIVGTSP